MTAKTQPRFTVMSVPGRDDTDEATWFVVDRDARPEDPSRSRQCDNRQHAAREAARLNAENEVRYWKNILRLQGTAAGCKRYKVFPAGTDDPQGDIGLVVQTDKGGEWEVYSVGGTPLHLPVQKYATMDDALCALVVSRLEHSRQAEKDARKPAPRPSLKGR